MIKFGHFPKTANWLQVQMKTITESHRLYISQHDFSEGMKKCWYALLRETMTFDKLRQLNYLYSEMCTWPQWELVTIRHRAERWQSPGEER